METGNTNHQIGADSALVDGDFLLNSADLDNLAAAVADDDVGGGGVDGGGVDFHLPDEEIEKLLAAEVQPSLELTDDDLRELIGDGHQEIIQERNVGLSGSEDHQQYYQKQQKQQQQQNQYHPQDNLASMPIMEVNESADVLLHGLMNGMHPNQNEPQQPQKIQQQPPPPPQRKQQQPFFSLSDPNQDLQYQIRQQLYQKQQLLHQKQQQRRQQIQNELPTDPLLGSLSQDRGLNHHQDNINANQGLIGHGMVNTVQTTPGMDPSTLGMQPSMGQNMVGGVDLEAEKMKLLSRLNEINQKQQQQGIGGGSSSTSSIFSAAPQLGGSSNIFLQKKKPLVTSVASVGALGGGNSGETPLQSFLRAGRKSQMPTNQTAGVGNSAASAASIYANVPMELEAIQSQSELVTSNSFLQPEDAPTQFLSSMGRSSISQELVQKLSARNMTRGDGGMTTKHVHGGRNAAWGATAGAGVGDPSRKQAHYRTSGILPKHASESHLARKGLAKSKSRTGSVSRENSLYTLMKKSSSKNLMQREDSINQLLPTKRRTNSTAKHRLGSSRSVPHMMLNSNNNNMPSSTGGYQKNALW